MHESAHGVVKSGQAPVISPDSSPAEPALSARGLYKKWPASGLTVLAGVDLHIAPGSLALVGGPNGAGKTTLLRILAGLITPDAGTVNAGSLDIDRDRIAYQQRVVFLSAGNAGLYPRLTARQHLTYWTALALLARDRRASLIEQALGALELNELADRRVDRLSMGQRQRVRFARAVATGASVLLLDEPTTSLDGHGSSLLTNALAACLASGGSVVVSAPRDRYPDMPFDCAYELEDGQLVAA